MEHNILCVHASLLIRVLSILQNRLNLLQGKLNSSAASFAQVNPSLVSRPFFSQACDRQTSDLPLAPCSFC